MYNRKLPGAVPIFELLAKIGCGVQAQSAETTCDSVLGRQRDQRNEEQREFRFLHECRMDDMLSTARAGTGNLTQRFDGPTNSPDQNHSSISLCEEWAEPWRENYLNVKRSATRPFMSARRSPGRPARLLRELKV